MTRTTTLITLALAALSTLALGACGKRTVMGMVIDAPINRALVVDARDERLSKPGVPGVEVKILAGGKESAGIAPVATAVSDETGAFTFNFPTKTRLRGPIAILTDGDNVFRSTSRVYLPNTGQKLLINVRTKNPPASAQATTDGDP